MVLAVKPTQMVDPVQNSEPVVTDTGPKLTLGLVANDKFKLIINQEKSRGIRA